MFFQSYWKIKLKNHNWNGQNVVAIFRMTLKNGKGQVKHGRTNLILEGVSLACIHSSTELREGGGR